MIYRQFQNMFASICRYLGTMPNTYIFTKRLAEQVISDYSLSESLPCVIVRPSIGSYIIYDFNHYLHLLT